MNLKTAHPSVQFGHRYKAPGGGGADTPHTGGGAYVFTSGGRDGWGFALNCHESKGVPAITLKNAFEFIEPGGDI